MRISILTIGAVASIIAINSVFADTTVTSKQYVDTTRQATIAAADTNYEANGTGVSIVTYTNNAGVLGERYLCDEIEINEFGDCAGDSVVGGSGFNAKLRMLNEQIEQATNLPETTVTYKTCTEWLDGAAHTDQNCILWNLTDKNVYGRCSKMDDCAWLTPSCDSGTWGCCSNGRCACEACYK